MEYDNPKEIYFETKMFKKKLLYGESDLIVILYSGL